MKAMGHIESNGDSTFAIISLGSILLALVGLGTIAASIAIISGTISIIINWSKFVIKVEQVYHKIFKNKTPNQ